MWNAKREFQNSSVYTWSKQPLLLSIFLSSSLTLLNEGGKFHSFARSNEPLRLSGLMPKEIRMKEKKKKKASRRESVCAKVRETEKCGLKDLYATGIHRKRATIECFHVWVAASFTTLFHYTTFYGNKSVQVCTLNDKSNLVYRVFFIDTIFTILLQHFLLTFYSV